MKTCSFRGAQPRSPTEGLFCNEHEPEARYQFHPCGQSNCYLCSHMNNNEIDFNLSPIHEFINGYKTYLNCPAVCILVIFTRMKHFFLYCRLVQHRILSMF